MGSASSHLACSPTDLVPLLFGAAAEAAQLIGRVGIQDVLVATDVASKGLDFPDIQHVINYDMPDEIENYVRFRRSTPSAAASELILAWPQPYNGVLRHLISPANNLVW